MFTGIVEEVGKVVRIRRTSGGIRLEIEAKLILEDLKIGDSTSVSGVCLSAVELKRNSVVFEVMPETLRLTTLRNLRAGEEVNLERALKVGSRLGGHLVTGHIDGVGVIRRRNLSKGSVEVWIALPSALLKYAVEKGSVAVDGVSLTIARVRQGCLSVCLIPHTRKVTTLEKKSSGKCVNMEMDSLLKGRFQREL